MNKIIIIILLSVWFSFLTAQTFEMKTDNIKQIDETTITWELWIKKASGDDFGLFTWQLQWSFSGDILNGGTFVNDDIYISPGADAVFMDHYNSANAVKSPTNNFFSYTPSAFPNTGEFMTLVTEDWKHIATFSAQLSKNESPHNFASADPQFAHRLGGIVEVFAADNPYQGPGTQSQITGTLTTAPGATINTRELAGYYYSGEGNWSTTGNWNKVTTENANTAPSQATHNAIIAGSATVSDAREVNQLTVAEGGYLVLDENAKLTTGDLFNDNPSGAKSSKEAVTIAEWDFDNGGTLPYYADNGINANSSYFSKSNDATFYGFFDNTTIPGTSGLAPAGQLYFPPSSFPPSPAKYEFWVIALTTSGFQNLTLSSKQYVFSNTQTFQISWSIDGSTWNNVSGGSVNVAMDWTTGVINDLVLPSSINNLSTVYIRWLITNENQNGTLIDDIIIEGEPLPAGILVQSTASGTGSLIHNTTGVEATVKRYINRWLADGKGVEHGWHFLSSPVASQAIRPEFVPDVNPIPEYIDFYKWDESYEDEGTIGWWINAKDATFYWNNEFEDNFVVGRGYLMAYGTPEKEYGDKAHLFDGAINVEDKALTGLSNTPGSTHRGWHLAGNPFASAIDWNQGNWTKTNIGAIPQIWNESSASYTVLSDETSNIIPAENGFMVYTPGNGAITIPADARVHSNTPWYKSGSDGHILLTANDAQRGTLQETIIRFNPDATENFDLDYDATYISGFAPMFYSVSGGKLFALNTLPQVYSELEIPMGFVKNSSENFTIEVQQSIPDVPLYLHDLKLNIVHNLNDNPVYAFTSKSGDDPNRFVLKFGVVSISDVAQQNIRAWFSDGYLFFDGTGETHIAFTDMTGRTIATETVYGVGLQNLPVNLPLGIYIAVLCGDSNSQAMKIIIQ